MSQVQALFRPTMLEEVKSVHSEFVERIRKESTLAQISAFMNEMTNNSVKDIQQVHRLIEMTFGVKPLKVEI